MIAGKSFIVIAFPELPPPYPNIFGFRYIPWIRGLGEWSPRARGWDAGGPGNSRPMATAQAPARVDHEAKRRGT